jgi:hypothetical protein
VAPYVLMLMESENGLGFDNPHAEEYDRTYRALVERQRAAAE